MKQNNFGKTVRRYGLFNGRFYAVLSMGILLISTGCTSHFLKNARDEFYSGSPNKAAEILHQDRRISKRDRLVFLMERGLILHHHGLYEESTSALLKASRLIEQQEIINAGRQVGSLVTSEWLTEYKGEYSERLWVHTYLMINFLLMYNYEDALVEAKQALQVFEKHPEALSDDFFTRGLIALCFENLGLDNDAFIEYKKLAELMYDPTPVARKLYQLGTELGFQEEADLYEEYIPEEEIGQVNETPYAELVLFISQGKSPVKIPGNIVVPPSIRFSFPQYEDSEISFFNTEIIDLSGEYFGDSISTNVGRVVRASFKKRVAGIIAKETARVAAKEVIAQQAGNDAVEIVLRAIFFILEEPDTRSWQTLPARLTMIRLPLEQADQNMTISIGGEKRMINLSDEEIRSDRRIYRSIRVYN